MTADAPLRPLLAGLAIGGIALGWMAGCSRDAPTPTVRVVRSGESIQAAVDAASPGDRIEIRPGTYHEEVLVETEDLVLSGTDRNGVVLDGDDELATAITVAADRVAVENLTVTGYHQNGILYNGALAYGDGDGVPGGVDRALEGFRVSYVTAYGNGGYGVYAFASRDGTIDHVFASGHPDSGIYVGQCQACDVVVRDSVAERNAVGILLTNASGDVQVVRNRTARNRLGISVNSDHAEELGASSDVQVVGNLVADNDDPATPTIARGFFGGGIALAGARDSLVARNRVVDHEAGVGIVVASLAGRHPEGDRVLDNVLAGNALDLALVPDELPEPPTCFAGNEPSASLPDDLEGRAPCDGPPRDLTLEVLPRIEEPPGVDYRRMRAPGPQPTMPARFAGRPAAADPLDPDHLEVPS